MFPGKWHGGFVPLSTGIILPKSNVGLPNDKYQVQNNKFPHYKIFIILSPEAYLDRQMVWHLSLLYPFLHRSAQDRKFQEP